MFTHVVLFELKDLSAAEAVAERLRAMPPAIPSLDSVEVGVDVLRGERSMDLCLITRFADRESYEAYAVHPAHLELLGWLRPQLTRSVVADWSSSR